MSTWVIARRELAAKRFVFITAALLALFPFAATLLPGTAAFGNQSFVVSLGPCVAIGFTLGLACILGVSTIGRELADKRLSFYFAKPVAGPAIWYGKLLAAMVMIGSSFAIIIVPVLLFYSIQAWRMSWNIGIAALIGIVALSALALFLITHAASTMVRSRSPFVLLDVALACMFAAAAYLLLQTLLAGMAVQLTIDVGAAMLALTLLAFVGAGGWQLARGRTDRRQSHLELSRFLWTSLAVILAVAGTFVGWVVTATPADLARQIVGRQADAGPWMFVGGRTRNRLDYRAAYLFNGVDGSFIRLRKFGWNRFPTPFGPFGPIVFGRDGRTVAWTESSSLIKDRLEIVTRRLEPGARVVHTGITTGHDLRAIVLSDDGSRIALVDGALLRVVDLRNGHTLGSARLGGQYGFEGLFFASPGVVRIYGSTYDPQGRDARLRILEFDTARRALTVTAEVHRAVQWVSTIVAPDGKTMLLRDGSGAQSLMLADARTAAPIVIAPSSAGGPRTILDDGRYVYVKGSTLYVVSREPSASHAIDLGATKDVTFFSNGPTPGKLIVSTGPHMGETGGRGWSSMLVDVDRGVIERRETGLRPKFNAGGWGSWGIWGYPSSDPRQPRADATRPLLFDDEHGAIVRWNPLTGERKTLIP